MGQILIARMHWSIAVSIGWKWWQKNFRELLWVNHKQIDIDRSARRTRQFPRLVLIQIYAPPVQVFSTALTLRIPSRTTWWANTLTSCVSSLAYTKEVHLAEFRAGGKKHDWNRPDKIYLHKRILGNIHALKIRQYLIFKIFSSL